ncbi:unnamed protein product [Closterium sp. NIES-64]|nr:unnamed protein product [Closterium sp. NIES-64]
MSCQTSPSSIFSPSSLSSAIIAPSSSLVRASLPRSSPLPRQLNLNSSATRSHAASSVFLGAFDGLHRQKLPSNPSSSSLSHAAAFHEAADRYIQTPSLPASAAADAATCGRRAVVTAVFERFTERAIKAVMMAQAEAKVLGRKEVATEQLLLGLIAEDFASGGKPGGYLGLGMTIRSARGAVGELIRDGRLPAAGGLPAGKPASEVPFSSGSKRVFEKALEESRKHRHNFIAPEHLAVALVQVEQEGAALVMASLGVQQHRLHEAALARLKGELDRDGRSSESISNPSSRPATSPTSPGSKPPSSPVRKGRGKKAAQQSALEQFCTDLTAMAVQGEIDPVIGREAEVARVVQILARRTKNNPLLLGEPGVGKTAIAEGLALRITESDVPRFLQGKRLLSLDMGRVMAGAKERGELELRVTSLVAEAVAAAGEVILVIDEVHTMVGAGAVGRGRDGGGSGLDISNLLKPALSRGQIQCIATTTTSEFRKHLEKDKALARRFQPVTVDEPSEEAALAILHGLRHLYEAHHKCTLSDSALAAAVTLSARFIPDRCLPDKAIDLIDEAASRSRVEGSKGRRRRASGVLERGAEEYWREIRMAQAAHEAAHARQNPFTSLTSFLSQDHVPADTTTAADAAAAAGRSKSGITGSDKEEGPTQITAEHIAGVAAHWTGIPLQQLSLSDQQHLAGLEEALEARERQHSRSLHLSFPSFCCYFPPSPSPTEITAEHIAAVAAHWTGIPLQQLSLSDQQLLAGLEEALEARERQHSRSLHLSFPSFCCYFPPSPSPTEITAEHIAAVAAHWTGIPLQQLSLSDQQLLAGLEEALETRVVGQGAAVRVIARAVQRARVGLKGEGRPVAALLFSGPTGVGKTELCKALAAHYYGSTELCKALAAHYYGSVSGHRLQWWNVVGRDEGGLQGGQVGEGGAEGGGEVCRSALLFSGPTGVGKTELCKALAAHYYGSEDSLIRLDMSEYMERHAVSKLIGAPPGYVGYGEGGKLTEAVRRRPFCLILLDEIEKAHPDVFNLLLQIFEDGRLTDSQGRHVSFKNALIVLTSNVGSQAIARGGTHRIGFLCCSDSPPAPPVYGQIFNPLPLSKTTLPPLSNPGAPRVVQERPDSPDGRHVSFKNALIVLTSNVGSQAIARGGTHRIGFLSPGDYAAADGNGGRGGGREVRADAGRYAGMKEVVMEELKAHFRPELMNRIDEVVVFRALEKEQIRVIATMMVKESADHLALKGINLEVSEALMERICEEGYDRAYGARPLRRAVTRLVDDPISEAVLAAEGSSSSGRNRHVSSSDLSESLPSVPSVLLPVIAAHAATNAPTPAADASAPLSDVSGVREGAFTPGDTALVDVGQDGEPVVIRLPRPDVCEMGLCLPFLKLPAAAAPTLSLPD